MVKEALYDESGLISSGNRDIVDFPARGFLNVSPDFQQGRRDTGIQFDVKAVEWQRKNASVLSSDESARSALTSFLEKKRSAIPSPSTAPSIISMSTPTQPDWT